MFFISFHFTSGSYVVEVQSGYNIILQRRFGEVKKHGAFMRTGKPAAHCTLKVQYYCSGTIWCCL